MEKTIPCRWFMGCNSQNGFYSLFGQFTRPEEDWRCILIKGGPGTGKSTLMKRVIKLALQRGQPVEEIHCSSDAASLDGVILPRQRTVLLDATPPHALEPQFPGAVEQPFSLCGCWDEELLVPGGRRSSDWGGRSAGCTGRRSGIFPGRGPCWGRCAGWRRRP